MFPTINVLGKDIGLYTIAAIIGVFVAGIFMIKQGKKRNIDENDFIIVLIIMAIGILFGGHILYGITNFDILIKVIKNFDKINSFKLLLECLILVFGGSVFYGGLIGGLFSVFIYSKIKKFNLTPYKDILGCGIPLFHSFGRIGCFLGGCCFGIESKVGFTYHHAIIKEANGVRRFPVQLLESFLCLMLFIFLYNLLKKHKFKNKLLYFYFIIYGTIRFLLEFIRGDAYRGFLFGLSTSQIISCFLIIYAIIRLLLMKRSEKNG